MTKEGGGGGMLVRQRRNIEKVAVVHAYGAYLVCKPKVGSIEFGVEVFHVGHVDVAGDAWFLLLLISLLGNVASQLLRWFLDCQLPVS